MITVEEYTAARTLVEAYHRQMTESIREIDDHHNVSLKSFMANVELSERLRNALKVLMQRFGNIRLEEIRSTDLMHIHNTGMKSCEEFMEKRRQYLKNEP